MQAYEYTLPAPSKGESFSGRSSMMPVNANINKPMANACLIALNPKI